MNDSIRIDLEEFGRFRDDVESAKSKIWDVTFMVSEIEAFLRTEPATREMIDRLLNRYLELARWKCHLAVSELDEMQDDIERLMPKDDGSISTLFNWRPIRRLTDQVSERNFPGVLPAHESASLSR